MMGRRLLTLRSALAALYSTPGIEINIKNSKIERFIYLLTYLLTYIIYINNKNGKTKQNNMLG